MSTFLNEKKKASRNSLSSSAAMPLVALLHQKQWVEDLDRKNVSGHSVFFSFFSPHQSPPGSRAGAVDRSGLGRFPAHTA